MSRIIIISADTSAPRTEEICALREASPVGISEARQALVGAAPVVDVVLFENDHEEVAARLRAVCRSLRESKRPFRIYELTPDESWSSMDEPLRQKLELAPSALENILDRVASQGA